MRLEIGQNIEVPIVVMNCSAQHEYISEARYKTHTSVEYEFQFYELKIDEV